MLASQFLHWLDEHTLTQQEFLSDPEICTREVLQQILEAAWPLHAKFFSLGFKCSPPKTPGDDADLIQALSTDESEIKFCDVLPNWSGEPNIDFLLICLKQQIPPNTFSAGDLFTLLYALLEERKKK
jgi:hypothetical protein